MHRLKRKRVGDDEQYGELFLVNIVSCHNATDNEHTPDNDSGSDTAGICSRDMSEDNWSISIADPGPIKIESSKNSTRHRYNNGRKFL